MGARWVMAPTPGSRQKPVWRWWRGAMRTVFLGPQWHFDLVRTGAFLYGFHPQPLLADTLPTDLVQPVLQLDLPVRQVREVSHGGTVGYGADARIEPKTRLAVVAGGYADGLNRLLGRQAVGIVGEHSTRVIGRISMDLTIFDISDRKSTRLNSSHVAISYA